MSPIVITFHSYYSLTTVSKWNFGSLGGKLWRKKFDIFKEKKKNGQFGDQDANFSFNHHKNVFNVFFSIQLVLQSCGSSHLSRLHVQAILFLVCVSFFESVFFGIQFSSWWFQNVFFSFSEQTNLALRPCCFPARSSSTTHVLDRMIQIVKGK